MRALTPEDTPVTLATDDVEVRTDRVGEMTVGFFRLAKGTNLAPALAGLEGDSCACPHWGYMLEGRVLMHTPDGDSVYEAGQAFYWAPGHVPEALEDSAYVDFSPTEELDAVIRHIKGG